MPRVVVDEAADAVEPRLHIALGGKFHERDDAFELGIVGAIVARLLETVDPDPRRCHEDRGKEDGGGDLGWLVQGHRWLTLAALKQFFDVGQLQLDIGRAAVVALSGERRLFHVAQ